MDICKLAAVFETTLKSGITESSATATLNSYLNKAGNALSGLYGFTFDEGTPKEEFTVGTIDDGVITFTLRGVDPEDPTLEVTALKQKHRKNSTVKITNYVALAQLKALCAGEQLFPSLLKYVAGLTPVVGQNHLAAWDFIKSYVDAAYAAGGVPATDANPGLSKVATLAQALAGTAGDGTYSYLVTPAVLQAILQGGASTYFLEDGTGADDTYTANVTPALTAYAAGQFFKGKITVANTGAATLNLNSLGAKDIKKYVSGAIAALETGDIIANQTCLFSYDGTQFILENPGGTTPTTALLAEMAAFFANTDMTGAEAEALTAGITTPIATLHAHKRTKLTATRVVNADNGAVTYAHGLGAIPNWVDIAFHYSQDLNGNGSFDRVAGTQACILSTYSNGPINNVETDRAVYYADSNGTEKGVISVGATNITITWTKTGSPNAVGLIMLMTCGV